MAFGLFLPFRLPPNFTVRSRTEFPITLHLPGSQSNWQWRKPVPNPRGPSRPFVVYATTGKLLSRGPKPSNRFFFLPLLFLSLSVFLITCVNHAPKSLREDCRDTSYSFILITWLHSDVNLMSMWLPRAEFPVFPSSVCYLWTQWGYIDGFYIYTLVVFLNRRFTNLQQA